MIPFHPTIAAYMTELQHSIVAGRRTMTTRTPSTRMLEREHLLDTIIVCGLFAVVMKDPRKRTP